MKKINMLSLLILGSLFLMQMSQSSCSNDKLQDPLTIADPFCDSLLVTYDLQIKSIIDNNCATSGCHVQGFIWGNYTSFDGLVPYLNDSQFKREVINTMEMPDGFSLSATDFELVECWVSKNYPES
jgi:hypothetical protein